MNSFQQLTKLRSIKANWNKFGKLDPLWSILTSPNKKGNKWELNEFFESGKRDIEKVFAVLDSLDACPNKTRALDFGCGVGRLSQALAAHFTEVVGIDIAASMIKLANKYNQYEHCKYLLNTRDDLAVLSSRNFDFIFSILVLQHMHPELSKGYIREFLRLLTPGGLLVFQLPAGRVSSGSSGTEPSPEKVLADNKVRIEKSTLKQFIKQKTPASVLSLVIDLREKINLWGKNPQMEMSYVKKNEIADLVRSNGGEFVKIEENQYAGPKFISYKYFIQKQHE